MAYYNNGPTIVSPVESQDKLTCYLMVDMNKLSYNYDRHDERAKASMQLKWNAFETVYIKNYRGTGGRIKVHFIRVIAVFNNDLSKFNILYHRNCNDSLIYNNDLDYWTISKKNEETPELDMYWSGKVKLWVIVSYYEPKTGKEYKGFFPAHIVTGSDFHEEATEFTVYDPEIQNISISTNPTTEFYKNSQFSTGGLKIKAVYRYVVDGSVYEVTNISNYTSNPSIGSKLTTPGEHNATISYGGKTTSYKYKVYGIKDFTKPELPEFIKLGAYTGDLENTVFTYDDNTVTSSPTSVSALVTPGFVGYFDVSYSAYASKTKQFARWGSAEEERFEDE